VFFYIEAVDLFNNTAISEIFNYTVFNDNIPPEINAFWISPENPYEFQEIKVYAEVSDNLALKDIYTCYRINGSEWYVIRMSENLSVFMATIPGQPAGTVIDIYVVARDIYGNTIQSQIVTVRVLESTETTSTGFIQPPTNTILLVGILVIAIAGVSIILIRKKRK